MNENAITKRRQLLKYKHNTNGHNYHQSLIVIAWYYKTEKNLEMISSSDVSQDEKIRYRQQSHREKGAWPQNNWVG